MRRGVMLVGAGAMVLGAVACSDDGDDGDGGETATAAAAETVATSMVTAPPTAVETVPASTEPPETTAETLATVPEDGVPGIDSDDPFCQAWSEFAGSFQALSLAASFGDPAGAARLEVAASGAVTSAVATLDAEFPDAVESERAVFVDEFVGPFARRAQRAADELDAAGATGAQIDELGQLWLETIAEVGTDDPDLVLDVGAGLAGPLDAAVVVFGANVPPIPADPSLITDADASATLGYLADSCPDQGILAGNDVIDD